MMVTPSHSNAFRWHGRRAVRGWRVGRSGRAVALLPKVALEAARGLLRLQHPDDIRQPVLPVHNVVARAHIHRLVHPLLLAHHLPQRMQACCKPSMCTRPCMQQTTSAVRTPTHASCMPAHPPPLPGPHDARMPGTTSCSRAEQAPHHAAMQGERRGDASRGWGERAPGCSCTAQAAPPGPSSASWRPRRRCPRTGAPAGARRAPRARTPGWPR